ncbi:hypothetical protein E8E68_17505 [Pseudomonas sp. BN607]|nr:hypothetical protein [Pseudomonas sp. BN607]
MAWPVDSQPLVLFGSGIGSYGFLKCWLARPVIRRPDNVSVGAGSPREHGHSPCQTSLFLGPASSRDKPAPTIITSPSLATWGRKLTSASGG